FLVNPDGLQLQGYPASGDGSFAASLSSIRAPTAAIAPRATEAVEVTANLDSSAAIPTASWDVSDPVNTANFSTTISVYDSLGNAHSLDVYFVKTADNEWDYHVTVGAASVGATPPPDLVEVGGGSLEFTTDGALGTHTETTAVSIDFAGAT